MIFPMHTHTQVLWRNKWLPILFYFVVYYFFVKYVGKEHVNNLITAIREFYPVSEDCNGSLYFGITLKWNYQKCKVDFSMPGYVEAALHMY